jgi:hypothetical protein
LGPAQQTRQRCNISNKLAGRLIETYTKARNCAGTTPGSTGQRGNQRSEDCRARESKQTWLKEEEAQETL